MFFLFSVLYIFKIWIQFNLINLSENNEEIINELRKNYESRIY